MKSLIAALIVMAAPAMAFSAEEWRTYKNDKYQYEFQYPDSYEVVISGLDNDRDGRIVRIARKEVTRSHGIRIEMHPGMSVEQIMEEIMPTMRAPALSEIERGGVTVDTEFHHIAWRSTTVNGAPAVTMQARFAENDQLFMTLLIMDRVVITTELWSYAGFDEEFAERIISTFK